MTVKPSWYKIYTRVIDNALKLLWLALLVIWLVDGAKLVVK